MQFVRIIVKLLELSLNAEAEVKFPHAFMVREHSIDSLLVVRLFLFRVVFVEIVFIDLIRDFLGFRFFLRGL